MRRLLAALLVAPCVLLGVAPARAQGAGKAEAPVTLIKAGRLLDVRAGRVLENSLLRAVRTGKFGFEDLKRTGAGQGVIRRRITGSILEAELYDGSGVILVVWLGRRKIAGISPGRAIQVEGRIGTGEGARLMYNPRYELIP